MKRSRLHEVESLRLTRLVTVDYKKGRAKQGKKESYSWSLKLEDVTHEVHTWLSNHLFLWKMKQGTIKKEYATTILANNIFLVKKIQFYSIKLEILTSKLILHTSFPVKRLSFARLWAWVLRNLLIAIKRANVTSFHLSLIPLIDVVKRKFSWKIEYGFTSS